MGLFLTKEEKKAMGLESPKLKHAGKVAILSSIMAAMTFFAVGCGKSVDGKQNQNSGNARIETQTDVDIEREM